MFAARFDIVKVGQVGFSNSEPSELRVLNRVIRADRINETIELGADARHATKLLKEYGLESANDTKTPGAKKNEAESPEAEDSPLLGPAEVTKFRSAVMRAQYLSLERPDLVEGVKALARNMARPREGHLPDLKRLICYLRGKPTAVLDYRRLTVAEVATI